MLRKLHGRKLAVCLLGGAMYALERGLNMKWLGVVFALFAALASFGIGSGVWFGARLSLGRRSG